ncbi:MAG: hypothetical protein HOQ35_00485 [Acidobacteriaceae bacterium]|nr:hypothetical protein [Acidobacteriaceae bacterium]
MGAWLLHKLAWALGIGAVATMVLYMGDWAVWRIRVARGGGMDEVQRTEVQVASLKGNKLEYYYGGQWMAACSRSIFPQAGEGACWWIERHREVIKRY